MATPHPDLLTVPQVAERFQVTSQTIRNWIDHGILPALRVGRAFRVRIEDVEALLDRASANNTSLATRRDIWTPTTTSLPRPRDSHAGNSVWEGGHAALYSKRP